MTRQSPLLRTRNVSKVFAPPQGLIGSLLRRLRPGRPSGAVSAVSDVDIDITEGEVFGLVGESGCGKSTLGRMICSVYAPTRGNIEYRGQDLAAAERTKIQVVFQDPYASLNPRMTVGNLVGQAPLVHGIVEKAGLQTYVDDLFRQVGLDPALTSRYAHQLSGGQRQRVSIARALAVQPDLLVCDEAISALDVSIQAQILNLFADLRDSTGLTFLFISHDMGVVQHICDRVAVMYLGRIVELAPTSELFTGPQHPYTRLLLENLPDISRRGREFTLIRGEVPSPMNVPAGCAFHPRCPVAVGQCRELGPGLDDVAPGHKSACHLAGGD